MLIRPSNGLRRGVLSLVGAAAFLGAVPPPAHALVFVYACLCCRPGGTVRYITGWSSEGCDGLSNFAVVVACDDLFSGLTVNPPSGFGNGYAPAFDRAVPIGPPVTGPPGVPDTQIVMGYYPAADEYQPGSYSTRVFAIQQGGTPDSPNRFAPIDINLTGLDPTADSITTTSVLGGEPVSNPFDMNPGPTLGSGDITIVVQTYRAANPMVAVDTRLISIVLASLPFEDATPLPPACLGDCDRSGSVSFADVTSTLANFNQTYPVGVLNLGDANGDRVVNFGDVTTILANFGATCM